MDPGNTNLVEPQDGCPVCGQRDADLLVHLDDGQVECQICGKVYKPQATEPDSDPSL
jgi:rubredoxin